MLLAPEVTVTPRMRPKRDPKTRPRRRNLPLLLPPPTEPSQPVLPWPPKAMAGKQADGAPLPYPLRGAASAAVWQRLWRRIPSGLLGEARRAPTWEATGAAADGATGQPCLVAEGGDFPSPQGFPRAGASARTGGRRCGRRESCGGTRARRGRWGRQPTPTGGHPASGHRLLPPPPFQPGTAPIAPISSRPIRQGQRRRIEYVYPYPSLGAPKRTRATLTYGGRRRRHPDPAARASRLSRRSPSSPSASSSPSAACPHHRSCARHDRRRRDSQSSPERGVES
mmetsp:Transcript_53167/g.159121  ORF Transcript_53167/g.159121 Transcript_53167/m.159121 type:complete len:282 (-) Transcript_53167:395-1240(-)